MNIKTFATGLATVAVALALTACSGGSDTPPATPKVPSASPTTTTPAATTAPATTAPTKDAKVTAKGEAVTKFGQATADQALTVAGEAMKAGMLNTTVLANREHEVRDFHPVTKYLSPAALAAFEKDFKAYQNGDGEAAKRVYRVSIFQDGADAFTPDPTRPVTAFDMKVDPTVTVDTTDDTNPRLMVKATATVTYNGKTNGKPVQATYVRASTFALTTTGDKANPVAIDAGDAVTDAR